MFPVPVCDKISSPAVRNLMGYHLIVTQQYQFSSGYVTDQQCLRKVFFLLTPK